MTISTGFDVRPLTPAIGATILGLDLSHPLEQETIDALRAALARHGVLFFRNQSLTPESQAAFARQFGDLTPAHPVIPSIEGHPEVLRIDGSVDRAAWWHTDVTFLRTPPLGTILAMHEAPPVGGDTMWASTQAAYDALSDPVRALCDGLIAVHHDPWFAAEVAERGGFEWDGRHFDALRPAVHPVVRTHPETGRNGLFVNAQFTRMIVGMSTIESDAVLDMLYRHLQRPEFTCRFRWEAGSVAFWDNRSTLHYAVDDYGEATRVANRITLRGSRPYGPAAPEAASAT